MSRLTFRDGKGNYCFYEGQRIRGQLVDKLAAYEDINESPAALFDINYRYKYLDKQSIKVESAIINLCNVAGIDVSGWDED